MSDQKVMTKSEVIAELRKEADELENKRCSLAEYARNSYKAKIRRNLADKLEAEMQQTDKTPE